MLRKLIAVLFIIFLFPISAAAEPLTKQEYFELYSKIILRDKIAARMEQMYTLLDAAGKAQARTILKQDILDAIQAQIDSATASYITPMLENETNVNDTTLP